MLRRYTSANMSSGCWIITGLTLSLLLFAWPVIGEDATPVERYILNYPVAQQFCPPVDSYADDVTEAIQKRGGRTIRHQLNGGYGLPVIITVGDQHVLHLGADVAWYRVGAPVYAIADGVVRVSQGPPAAAPDKHSANAAAAHTKVPASKTVEIKNQGLQGGDLPMIASDGAAESMAKETADERGEAKPGGPTTGPKSKGGNPAATRQPSVIGWGNIIAIEHHLPDGLYVTSIYGHLGNARRVSAGDVVHAGQMIGTVGPTGAENGGFKPHLHFGMRSGRMFEPERNLFTVFIQGKTDVIKLVNLDEQEVELEVPQELPLPLDLQLGGSKFTIFSRERKTLMPAAALNYIQPADFAITGYGLSTDGWLDPTEFLSQMLGRFPQAPFGGAQRQPAVPANQRR